ncbi:MAG: DUF1499 domain-containing protein [Gemmatimonadota bacterium]
MNRNLLQAVVRGLTRNVAFTAPSAEDPRLRGRTYAIPFEDVWQASLYLVKGGLRRWELLEADDQEGVIRGAAHGPFGWLSSSITVRIVLDADAQTRIDALSASRTGRGDLGANARRLARFFAALDRRLAAAGHDTGARPRGRRATLPEPGSG